MPKQILVGEVVSRSDKTALVRVKRLKKFPLYGKSVVRFKKFASHDPQNVCHKGDWVRIQESRPFSKTKHWLVMEKVPREGRAEGGERFSGEEKAF